MRGDDGVLVRGKFTPIRSGHLPPQSQVNPIYAMPTMTGSAQGQRTMSGALGDDQPIRLVRFEDQDRTVDYDLRSRNGRGAKPEKKKTERSEKWLKYADWFIFCCGLCDEGHPYGDSRQHTSVGF